MEYKEDWTSVTKAALAGGIVTILAMPNTDPAIVDEDTFNIMSRNATSKACCDYGLYVGASSENASTISSLSHKAVGLKMYLNETFTCLSLGNKLNIWRQHFEVSKTQQSFFFTTTDSISSEALIIYII